MSKNIQVPVCNKCGTPIESPKIDFPYGTPIRVCKNCNNQYYDSRFKEIAISGVDKDDKKLVNPFYFITLAGGLLLCVPPIIELLIQSRVFHYALFIVGIPLFLWSLFSIFKQIITYKNRMKKLEEEKLASSQRLNDPNYRDLLRQYGVNI